MGRAWPRAGDGKRPRRIPEGGRGAPTASCATAARAGQHADVCRGNAAQPGCCRDQRRSHGESGGPAVRTANAGLAARQRARCGRGGQPGELRQRGGLPGQVPGLGLPGDGGSRRARSCISAAPRGGEGADQRSCPAAARRAHPGRPGKSPGVSPCIAPIRSLCTPARAESSASRRRPRCAATFTAPGVLPTIRSTSPESGPPPPAA